MADQIVLDLKITVPTILGPAGDMPDRWVEGMLNNAERLYDRWQEVISDEGKFQSILAEISSQKWRKMVDPAFVSEAGKSRDNIVRFQYKKLTEAFDKLMEKYQKAFATVDGVFGKNFKDNVTSAKDRWANAMANGTLRLTGDKVRGRVVTQMGYWLTGDPKANRFSDHVEVISGGPYDFTKSGLRKQFRSAITNLLISAGMYILKADMEAGEMTAQNARLVDTANSFRIPAVKPFVAGGGATDSLLEYEYADPELKLHARIVLV
ncbi:MAG: hypothetical protein HZA49_10495 [Planctomycetes bacterium]|nr:hypothetical protein [Planctomycetota bacterium]